MIVALVTRRRAGVVLVVHLYGVVDPDSSADDLSTALAFCRCATMFYATINIHNTQENKTKLPLINHTVSFSTSE